MQGIISKRPIIGFIAGGIFSALGKLILAVDHSASGMTSIRSGLHTGIGFFLVFVGVFSIIAAVLSIWSAYRSKKQRPSAPAPL